MDKFDSILNAFWKYCDKMDMAPFLGAERKAIKCFLLFLLNFYNVEPKNSRLPQAGRK